MTLNILVSFFQCNSQSIATKIETGRSYCKTKHKPIQINSMKSRTKQTQCCRLYKRWRDDKQKSWKKLEENCRKYGKLDEYKRECKWIHFISFKARKLKINSNNGIITITILIVFKEKLRTKMKLRLWAKQFSFNFVKLQVITLARILISKSSPFHYSISPFSNLLHHYL